MEDLGAFRWKNGRCAAGPLVIIMRISKVPGIPVDSHPTCVAGVILLMHERIGEKIRGCVTGEAKTAEDGRQR